MKLSPAARARYAASTGRGAERDTIDGQAGELDVSGSASALATSIEMVRTLGTVVLAGLAGRSAETALRPDQLVWKEIRLQGYVKGEVAYSKALQFISTRGQTYPLDCIVSHVYSLDRAVEAIMAASRRWPPRTR